VPPAQGDNLFLSQVEEDEAEENKALNQQQTNLGVQNYSSFSEPADQEQSFVRTEQPTSAIAPEQTLDESQVQRLVGSTPNLSVEDRMRMLIEAQASRNSGTLAAGILGAGEKVSAALAGVKPNEKFGEGIKNIRATSYLFKRGAGLRKNYRRADANSRRQRS
jgi:hypothetical protein